MVRGGAGRNLPDLDDIVAVRVSRVIGSFAGVGAIVESARHAYQTARSPAAAVSAELRVAVSL
jgi:hypothetical protein